MRILIAGFPHSGTSILRKLVGNHPEVHDHFASETRRYTRDDRLLRRIFPRRYGGRRHVVFKWPFHDVEAATNAHRVIYIVRSPFDAFGSLWQRFGGELPDDHSPAAWQAYARFLLDRPSSDRHCFVRYEDLFRDDYRVMRSLMDWLGLGWHEDIVRTESRYAPIRFAGDRPQAEPERRDHAAFRAWQTSQAFVDKSGQSQRHLPVHVAQALSSLPECNLLGYHVEEACI
jgi:hypothetical protein